MATVSREGASRALKILSERSANRQEELDRFENAVQPSDVESDDESDSPFLDQFVEEGGGEAVHQMTNFSLSEFLAIWNVIEDTCATSWMSGRGRRKTFRPKDVLLMTMTTIKHGGNWDLLGKNFNVRGNTFERTVISFVTLVGPVLYDSFISK